MKMLYDPLSPFCRLYVNILHIVSSFLVVFAIIKNTNDLTPILIASLSIALEDILPLGYIIGMTLYGSWYILSNTKLI